MLLDGGSKALEWRTNLKNQKLIAENQHSTNAFLFCAEMLHRIQSQEENLKEKENESLTNTQVWSKEQPTALK